MPRYDYDCAACGTRFEVVHGVYADPPTTCPVCGAGTIKKAFAPPTIHFKGSGWAKKERRSTVAPGSTTTTGGDVAATAGESGTSKGGEAGKGDAGKADPAKGEAGKPTSEAPTTTSTTVASGSSAD